MHSGFGELRNRCPMNCSVRIRLHETGEPLQTDLDRIAEIWTQGLARFGGPYLCGAEFSAADAFFAPVVFRAQTFDLFPEGQAQAYVRLMLEHPAMKEWYAAAISEPWRDDSHEKEIAMIGDVEADYRRDQKGSG